MNAEQINEFIQLCGAYFAMDGDPRERFAGLDDQHLQHVAEGAYWIAFAASHELHSRDLDSYQVIRMTNDGILSNITGNFDIENGRWPTDRRKRKPTKLRSVQPTSASNDCA